MADFQIRSAELKIRSTELQIRNALFLLLSLGRHLGPPSLTVYISYFAFSH
jgi:hypothetical protein